MISETLAIYLILMIKLERLHESLANPIVSSKFSKGESQKFLMSLHVAVGWGVSPQTNNNVRISWNPSWMLKNITKLVICSEGCKTLKLWKPIV